MARDMMATEGAPMDLKLRLIASRTKDARIQGKPTKWTNLSPAHNAHVCVFDNTYHRMMLNDIGVVVTSFILNKKI